MAHLTRTSCTVSSIKHRRVASPCNFECVHCKSPPLRIKGIRETFKASEFLFFAVKKSRKFLTE